MNVPIATYRIQFTPDFRFGDAETILDYLRDLGISHLYASPIFAARAGSGHGYDVLDPTAVSQELGGGEGFLRLRKLAGDAGLGWLQDIVPNHMAFDSGNRLLMDLLENGPDARAFGVFDINWEHPYAAISGRVLAPMLGSFYAECLEKGEIRLQYGETGLSAAYYDFVFPLRVETYASVLAHELPELRSRISAEHPDFLKFQGVLYAIRTLPGREHIDERYEQIGFIKRMLWELYQQNRSIREFIDGKVSLFNGTPGEPASFDLLDELLAQQYFRFAFWKVGTEEINYRRFFTVNDLISIRAEHPEVFHRTHELILEYARKGLFDGLRVDHVDGLYDPSGYLDRLRDQLPETYLAVEKIIAHPADLPDFWPIQGTTGYDFLHYAGGLLCRREEEPAFDRIYRKFTGFRGSFRRMVRDKKMDIIGKHLAGDVDNLAQLLAAIASRSRYGSDFTLVGIRKALAGLLGSFPVYRTYISERKLRDADRRSIRRASVRAARVLPDYAYEISFIRDILLLKFEERDDPEIRSLGYRFVQRFQQLTGPIMAKGFEDTVFYVYNRLLSLNEVGSDPGRFGVPLAEFHRFCAQRAAHWPHGMNAASTHDTKRGEDVRARIAVLSEIPREWESRLALWNRMNRGRKSRVRDRFLPDRNDEYLIYQTLLGAWPFVAEDLAAFPERMENYLIKAIREAKVHTGWLNPEERYEDAAKRFLSRLLEGIGENAGGSGDASGGNDFLAEFLPFQRKIAWYGIFGSLSQTLIRLTAPGLPDFYQGSELWDLSLVDPDNRRPVDFDLRRRYLDGFREAETRDRAGLLRELLEKPEDGRIKLYLIRAALGARRDRRDIWDGGEYVPLEVTGRFRDHVIAYSRGGEAGRSLVIAPRFLTGVTEQGILPLGDLWEDTAVLPPGGTGALRDAFGGTPIEPEGGTFPLRRILATFPTALLVPLSDTSGGSGEES